MEKINSYPEITNNTTELCNLAKKYGTDKVSHGYTKYYDLIFKKDKNNNINFLELGIFRGSSILMWNDYFSKSTIYCIDNCEKEKCSGRVICQSNTVQKLNEYPRIKAYYCNQDDEEKINKIFNNIEFDYICDDASHYQKETLKSLAILFKKLKSGGKYIIEDICLLIHMQTGSYWGQKNGIRQVGKCDETWKEEYNKTGKLKDKEFYNDSIFMVLENYLKTNKFESEYLTKEENDYLTDNIKNIKFVSHSGIRPLGIKYSGSMGSLLNSGSFAVIEKKL